ncbi:hypothetical protein H6F96_15320 [Microcoleus sp. FACHB-53]|nr:hypothetical protein [Microcoleus sp. FACHB-53]
MLPQTLSGLYGKPTALRDTLPKLGGHQVRFPGFNTSFLLPPIGHYATQRSGFDPTRENTQELVHFFRTGKL